jgi:hypothetical protein
LKNNNDEICSLLTSIHGNILFENYRAQNTIFDHFKFEWI